MEVAEWIKTGVELAGTVIVVVGAAIGTIVAVRVHLAILSTKMDMQERSTIEAIKRIEAKVDPIPGDVSAVKTRVALTDQRLLAAERMIDDLRRGEGRILPIYKSPYEVDKND